MTVTVGQTATADAGLAAGGSIGGTVTGSQVGALEDVLVLALGGDGVPRGLALTDETGAYSLRGLRQGSYTVLFIASLSPNEATRAFYDASYDTTPATPEPTPVEVGAGTAVTGINVTLSPGAQIAGTVSASDTGEPLHQAVVVFLKVIDAAEVRVVGVDLTDETGRYSSPALGPGAYKIYFSTALSPNASSRTYQDEFFSNAATLETAASVLVGKFLGTVTRNVELSPGGTVSGRVSASDTGAGLGGVFVTARQGQTVFGGAVTDEAGTYHIDGLPAGDVELTFATSQAPDLSVRAYAGTSAPATVVVGAIVTRDVELTPQPAP